MTQQRFTYQPWAIMCEYPKGNEKIIFLPEFDEQYLIKFDHNKDGLKIFNDLLVLFPKLIENRIKEKKKLNPPLSTQEMIEKYGTEGEGLSYTAFNFDIWDRINNIYPPAPDIDKAFITKEVPLDLNFWAAISKPDDADNQEKNRKNQFRYEVQFPEIEDDTARVFYAQPVYADICNEVDYLLGLALQDYLKREKDLPYKLLKQNAATICRGPDLMTQRHISLDDYLDMINDHNVEKTTHNNIFERILKPF